MAKKTVAAGTGALVDAKFFAIATTGKLPITDTKKPVPNVPTPRDVATRVAGPEPIVSVGKKQKSQPIFARWWFWTAVGAVVLAGSAVALSSGGTVNDIDPSLGQFDFGQF